MHTLARRLPLATLSLCLFVGTGADSAGAADDATPKTYWKYTLITPFNEGELMIFSADPHDGETAVVVKDSSKELGPPPKITKFTLRDRKAAFAFTIFGNEATFTGTESKDGRILGAMRIQGQAIPAKLAKTDQTKVIQSRPDPELLQAYIAASQERDPKTKVEKFQKLVKKDPGSPKVMIAYAELLVSAGAADLDVKRVRQVVEEWVDGARPFGPDYVVDVRAKALKALGGQKKYAEIALEMATETDKALGEDAPLETRAEVVKALATAAKLADKTEIAKEASLRSEKLEGRLDEEYHKTVPPFKPEISSGRKNKKSHRVVLLELFTGAQCPPCVAADVAFDALNQTYPTTELITLQYHLHIPGPDPLTSPDSEARQQYYPDFQGTPTLYFNGKPSGLPGGGMKESKPRYDRYRAIIEDDLDTAQRASIDLNVTRTDDGIKIVASATAEPREKKIDKGTDKDKEKKDGCDAPKEPAIKLRLALVEEEIRYVGGNRLRFHHHVVRAMPGGARGKELTDGQGKTEATVKLSTLRKDLEAYLSESTKTNGSFPNPLPEIKLEKLSVVAFVQDDGDQSVLHAVIAPVGESK